MLTSVSDVQKIEDKKRLEGPGLLLLDKNVTELKEAEYCVVDSGNGLQLATGQQPDATAVLARVLFCARPPRAEMLEKAYP